MKKRLLSAFLALAMMLTLLPTSVFAAPDAGSTAAKSTVTLKFNDLTPTGGWKTGDKVTVTSVGGTTQLNLNFAYSPAGADTAVIAKPDNGSTVARTEEKQDGASADGQIVAASTTVELPRFFAGSSDWTTSDSVSGYDTPVFNGRDTVTLTTSTETITDNFGTVTATRTTKDSAGKDVMTNSPTTVSIVHAVPPTVGGKPVSSGAAGSVTTEGVSVIRCTQSDGVRLYGMWYQSVTTGGKTYYYEATSGIVAGNRWYSSAEAYAASTTGRGKYPSNFTLAGISQSVSVSDPTKWPASMTVDLDGNTLVMPSYIPDTTSSLTITHNANQNQQYSSAAVGEVSGSISRNGGNKQLTLRLTNVKVSGSIQLEGSRNSVTMFGGEVTGSVYLDGKVTINGRDTYNGQSLSFNSENGNNSNTYTTVSGGITVTNADSSTLALHNVTGNSSVTYTGNAGRITVSGNSDLGKLEYGTRLLPADTNKNISPANVDIKGGRLTDIEHRSTDEATGRGTVDVANAVVSNTINMAGKCDYTVNIKAGTTGDAAITVPKGTLNINGTAYAPTMVGDINIGVSGAKAALNVSGDKVTGKNISSASGTLLTVNIPKTGKPADHAYTFNVLSLGDYAGHGIKGGTFDTQIINTHDKQWMDADLTFGVQLAVPGSKWTYYGSQELNQVFSDLGRTDAKTANKVYLAGQRPISTITLYDGNKEWAKIGYGDGCSFLLPTMMFGTPVPEWTYVSGSNVVGAVVKDNRLTTPGNPVDLKLTNKPGVDIATGIRKIQSSPEGVKAVLVGNVITLSGAVRDNGNGTARIYVTLETNVRNDADDPTDVGYGTVVVEVAYNTKTKETFFVTAQSADADRLGVKVEENRLTMNDGKVVYTLDGSGLGVPAANLDIYADSKEIQASVTKNGVTGAAKQEIIDRLTKGTFEWTNAYAIWEGVNAALKTYSSESTVTNWISSAQTSIWRSGLKDANGSYVTLSNGVRLVPHSGNFNATDGAEGTAIASAFSKAYLVPYLQINVTDFTSNLTTMTANLIPSYRIVISQDGYVQGTSAEYVVSGQTGRSLGTLTGSMSGGATLTFVGDVVGKFGWAHQDATYGYKLTSGALTINHVGAKDGLGTFVFNNIDSLIKLTHQSGAIGSNGNPLGANEELWYDTLQSAVNDTLPQVPNANKEDKIVVDGRYQGSYAISISGLARTFLVQVLGEKRLEVPSSSLIKSTVSGDTWTVQLLEDTVKLVNGNITIAEVTGGTARVSSNPAAEGQTVTITLVPAVGYRSNGVTVRTAANTAVTVNGSGNVYTFVMPATSVTVTPVFVTTSGGTATTAANVTVSSNTMGTATTTAMNGQITGGSVVGVTTYPNAGYRTMGVNVTTNGGSATATRTGDNSFNFTVPVNATAVTVTPVYDIDNGTKFTDVWSTSYYSSAVAWAVSKGIIGGQSTYSFGSNYNCKRADMMVMLYRAAGQPSVANVRNPFVDVSPSDYYYNAVMWAYSNGITGGVDTTHFGPSQSVTRAQTVTFLYRYAGQPAVSASSTFSDVSSGAYYAKAVAWAKNQGITGGKTLTSFAPNSNCLRAEIATFLYRDFTGTRA